MKPGVQEFRSTGVQELQNGTATLVLTLTPALASKVSFSYWFKDV